MGSNSFFLEHNLVFQNSNARILVIFPPCKSRNSFPLLFRCLFPSKPVWLRTGRSLKWWTESNNQTARCSSSEPPYFWSVLTLPWQAGRWGSVGFSRGSTGLESIYPDFPDRRDGIPASSKSPTARLRVHRGWHMTATLITLVCLSIDIPPFLCLGHELQTILRECTLTVQQSRATNAIGRNVALDVALGLWGCSISDSPAWETASAVDGAVLRMCAGLSCLYVTFMEY